jgi:hypothetical protein
MLLARLVTARSGDDRSIDDRYAPGSTASWKPVWFVRLIAAIFGRRSPA